MRPLSQPGKNRKRSRYVLLVITLLTLTIITLDARGVPFVSSARDSSRDAIAPARSASRWLSSPFRNAWNGITGYGKLREENEELRQKLGKETANSMREKAAQEELAKLKEQLNISFLSGTQSQVARVTAGVASNFDDYTVEIDKGSDLGLAVGNPVVTKGGLVGRLVRVTKKRSVVQLLTDPDFFVGVTVGPDQNQGVGHGTGSSRTFIVDRGIDLTDVVSAKDSVFAGGIENSIMPPDLFIPIGTVDKLTADEAARVQVLQVNFTVEFGRLDVVQVIKWVPAS
ncbi:MAG: rod shape-determining protein MreC [Microthrixaceae bacterium]